MGNPQEGGVDRMADTSSNQMLCYIWVTRPRTGQSTGQIREGRGGGGGCWWCGVVRLQKDDKLLQSHFCIYTIHRDLPRILPKRGFHRGTEKPQWLWTFTF